ncbi:MAG: penicillin-binding transpeptidase domain-containing protein [Desulfobacterales bacterium]|jgi:cell division protein FtsI/penicillin-binding protein 2
MSGKRGTRFSKIEGSSWRAYQSKLKRARKSAAAKKFVQRNLKYIPVLIAVCALVYGLLNEFSGSQSNLTKDANQISKADPSAQADRQSITFKKNDLHHFITSRHISDLQTNSFDLRHNGNLISVQTSIDISLQNYLTAKLDRKNSSKVGIVVMVPTDGRILAMVGYDKSDPFNNPCTDSSFPAASIFKIVTAAAAIEKCRLDPDSKLHFNGRKHTLYKSQLKEIVNKYTHTISLKDAFAKSVNPVFGKIGAMCLDKDLLESYAKAIGFYRIIDFEIFLPPSLIVLSNEPYQLAETACGFTRKTRISPIHGALIAATTLNQGRLIAPVIVDRITDENKNTLFRNRPVIISQAFTPKTAEALQELMKTTVQSGTVRGTFRKYRKDKIISKLEIGAKTGTINNQTNDLKYDWFVGYAGERSGDRKIILSVLVAHEKYIGTRATQYAIMAFKKYFKRPLIKKNERQLPASSF